MLSTDSQPSLPVTFAFAFVLLFACFHSLSAANPSGEATATDWNQWRGPDRTGYVSADWPSVLSPKTLVELWRVPLAESYSGPVVNDQFVYTTETLSKRQEVARCFDRTSGKQIWEQSWAGSVKVPFFAAANGSWIRSTPALQDDTLIVGGMEGILVALDATDGKVRWQVDFRKRYETDSPTFGFVCSPLADGDALYVQAANSVLKMNAVDGSTIWRSAEGRGGMSGGAFSSPILTEIFGVKVLIVQTRESLLLLRATDGTPLAEQPIESFRGMNILTPVRYGNAIFTSAHSGKAQLWDVVKEGDDDWRLEERWQNGKLEAYMSSPIVIGQHAYLLLRNQRFCCIDLETGNENWRTQPYGKYWSLVTNGDKLLALDERGLLLLIQANPEKFELLQEMKISETPTWAHLAVAGDQIFVRELNALVAYRWKSN